MSRRAATRLGARGLLSSLLAQARWRAEKRKPYGSRPKTRGRLSARHMRIA